MNMFSVWTLSSLILSYTLAFPILNDTSSLILSYTFARPILNDTSTESLKAVFSNSIEVKGNSMESSWNILPNFTDQGNGSRGGVPFIIGRGACLLPTCNVHILTDKLQAGDEIAGKITQDPYGPGKK